VFSGIEIQNRGQIKFVRTSPSSCNITLIISYEVPDALVPFANVSDEDAPLGLGSALLQLYTRCGSAELPV
jgi:hypothetical protein